MTDRRVERRALRMDWRHLLPTIDRPGRITALVLGLTAGDADALVDCGLVDEVLDLAGDGPRPVDLVVAGASVPGGDLQQAAQRLAAGGALYVERTRAYGGKLSLRAARQASRWAGLVEVGRWAALPDLSGPRRLLPLDHPGALRWYFRCNFRAGDTAARAGRLVLLASSVVPRAVERLVPTTIFVATRLPSSPPTAIPGESVGPDCRRVVITSGHDAGSRSIVLPFEPRSAWPSVVIKVATRRQLGDATREEHERLTDLWKTLPAAVARALPVPLSSFELSGLTAAAEAPARGETMWARSGRWSLRTQAASDDLDDMTEWLIGFAQATARDGPSDPAADWLERPLADLRLMVTVDTNLEELIMAAARELRSCPSELHSVAQHYDAGPWNVIRTRDGLCVLDWELDRQAGRDGFGPPLVDLLYFVASWHSLAQGITSAEGQTRDLVSLFGRTTRECWQTEMAHRAVARYEDRIGVAPALTRPLLVALWLERAVSSRRRWHRLEAGTPWDDAPLRYLKALARVR